MHHTCQLLLIYKQQVGLFLVGEYCCDSERESDINLSFKQFVIAVHIYAAMNHL